MATRPRGMLVGISAAAVLLASLVCVCGGTTAPLELALAATVGPASAGCCAHEKSEKPASSTPKPHQNHDGSCRHCPSASAVHASAPDAPAALTLAPAPALAAPEHQPAAFETPLPRRHCINRRERPPDAAPSTLLSLACAFTI